jgi:predicted DNA binding protein
MPRWQRYPDVRGNSTQVGKFFRLVRRTGISYGVVSLEDARFSPLSPLNKLTENQRRVLISAYELGYYDLLRRISTGQLAAKLGMHDSTFVVHRIKAERRLIAAVLSWLNEFHIVNPMTSLEK